MGTFKLSTIVLKKNGTCTFKTLPATSNVRAPMTRNLTLGLFFGQILPASLTMIDQSVLSCDSVATGLEVLREVGGVVEAFEGTVGD